MKFDLSSQIVLNQVPKRYYYPENEFELSTLTRYEKLPTHIYESSHEVSLKVAREIAAAIKDKQTKKENLVIALPGGHSPQTIYQELVRMHKEENLSFQNVIVFAIYEFYPLVAQPSSNFQRLKEQLLDLVDIDWNNVYVPDGFVSKEKVLNYCKSYEALIQQVGGIDFILLGLGRSGNIGLNISGSNRGSQTRLVLLDVQSKKEAISIFESIEKVPSSSITMGISTILKAKKIVLIAFGEDKMNSIYNVVEGTPSEVVPASFLQDHENAQVFIDLSAASSLTRISKPWLVTNAEWNNKLIRRAIVWLCQKLDKPILKLTNKDYRENGLEELLSLYGSAYNVNIDIFNDLQHTITGWPGGKPNADDTNRPERATPYPKRVVIFSPHPDDDVISMGGTFKRLVDQHHDVHVAYETSGNIAVGDEDVIRYVALLEDVRRKYDPSNETLKKKNNEVLRFLLHEKGINDIDTPDVLFLKAYIRRQEAIAADRYVGIDSDHVTFLDLPFYETGEN